MTPQLKGKRIAILATDGFEQAELTEPRKILQQAGAQIEILSIKEGEIRGWDKTDWGDSVKVDRLVTNGRRRTGSSHSRWRWLSGGAGTEMMVGPSPEIA